MLSKAVFYRLISGMPGRSMQYIGITGTDGKTTTSLCTYHVLRSCGKRVGVLSTAFVDVGEGLQKNKTKLTSMGHRDFRANIKYAEDNGCSHLVVEVSSHALHQRRTWPIRFGIVAITNISREHLDYHLTMDHYLNTKLDLFARVKAGACGIYKQNFSGKNELFRRSLCDSHLEFGYTSSCSTYVTNIQEHPELEYTLSIGKISYKVCSRVSGRFNCDNMMIASTVASYLGLEGYKIAYGLSTFQGVPGRQQLIRTKEGVTAMIDFALTPDALQTLYGSVRTMGFNRLIAVFGATGNRDQGKRPKMGSIAGDLCDIVILTEDENYHEDGLEIMKQVEKGLYDKILGDDYFLIQDRKEAITHGIAIAQEGDIIIVTGMADFTSREMNEGTIPWDEKNVIEDSFFAQGYTLLDDKDIHEKGVH